MSVKSFRKKKEEPVEAEVVEEKETNEETQLATTFAGGVFEGEWDVNDSARPRLSTVQGTQLIEKFPGHTGEFLYDKSVTLSHDIKVIWLKLIKRFKEDVQGWQDKPPRWFTSKDEADAEGVAVKNAAIGVVAIEIPENLDEADEYSLVEHDGKGYMVAEWWISGTGFQMCRTVMQDARIVFKGGDIYKRFYNIHMEKRAAMGNTYYAPVPKLTNEDVPQGLIAKFADAGLLE